MSDSSVSRNRPGDVGASAGQRVRSSGGGVTTASTWALEELEFHSTFELHYHSVMKANGKSRVPRSTMLRIATGIATVVTVSQLRFFFPADAVMTTIG